MRRTPLALTCFRHRVTAFFLPCLAAGLLQSANAATPDWRPAKNVEIIVPAGAGGGNDRTARTLQLIFMDSTILPVTTSVVNRPGGGHAVAYSSLGNHSGDGHYVAIAQTNLLSNHITGRSTLNWTDVTPIALLGTEYIAIAVRADSPIRSGKDFADKLKKDVRALNISVATSLGNPNHVAVAKIAKSAGAEPKLLRIVIFNSGPEALTALLGGHIDAVATLASNVVPHMERGAVRIIGVSAPRRLSGALAEVPTFQEQGVDAVAADWTAIIGPPRLTDGQVAFWERVLEDMSKTDSWRKYIQSSFWEHNFMDSRETKKFLERQYEETRAVLREIGLRK